MRRKLENENKRITSVNIVNTEFSIGYRCILRSYPGQTGLNEEDIGSSCIQLAIVYELFVHRIRELPKNNSVALGNYRIIRIRIFFVPKTKKFVSLRLPNSNKKFVSLRFVKKKSTIRLTLVPSIIKLILA